MSAPDPRMVLARRGAVMLYALGARRVWAFGSLARGASQDRNSDVDLAVEGMTASVADAAAVQISAALGSHVDVMAIEIASPQMRAAINRNRVLLPRTPEGVAPTQTEEGGTLPGWFARSTRDINRQLFLQRLEAVLNALLESGAQTVLDLGCGKGWLIELLARNARFTQIVGVDLDDGVLVDADRRLRSVLSPAQMRRVTLIHDVITRPDPRFRGFDAVVAAEVIEHMDPPRLAAFEAVVFEYVRPKMVIITTPNADYNAKWGMKPGEMRHKGHRFEWGRGKFEGWAEHLALRYSIATIVNSIGLATHSPGPTQLLVATASGRLGI